MSARNPRTRFWSFVKARHQAWAAKNGLAPAPKDEAIRRARFTNVFRVLDRGTLFAIEHVLPIADPADRAFAALMYRALNRIDSYQALVPPRAAVDPGLFLHALGQWRALGGKVYTGVYYSCHVFHGAALDGEGSPMDKRCAAYAAELAAYAPTLAGLLAGTDDRHMAFDFMRRATEKTLLGPFAINQAMLDLTYSRRHADTWVLIGPGARRALKLMGLPPTLDAVHLLEWQQPSIPWAPVQWNGRPLRLGLADVEHALCEWQKHERITAGGHAKGVYDPLANLKAGDLWRPASPVPPWLLLPRNA